jgi:hypothetical protein
MESVVGIGKSTKGVVDLSTRKWLLLRGVVFFGVPVSE